MMQFKICSTCGTEYQESTTNNECKICNDDRQYIPVTGQSWTTRETLLLNHSVRILEIKKNVYELEIIPQFAIGQRAFFIMSENGNILWDCFPLLNQPTIDFINSHGGLHAIAFSHPHYYSNMNVWAETFDCPIYIHQNDEQWIVNRGNKIDLWQGYEKQLWDGIKIINIGGHFPGSCILHVSSLSENVNVFCGDTFNISPSLKHISVMYSYPNRIPLSIKEIKRIKILVEKINFDTLYGFYSYQNLEKKAKNILMKSLDLYLK